MLRIHKPKNPSKRSGFALEPGKSTKVKGMTITNTTSSVVYIDKYVARVRKAKKAKR